jgi:hypothetical protein
LVAAARVAVDAAAGAALESREADALVVAAGVEAERVADPGAGVGAGRARPLAGDALALGADFAPLAARILALRLTVLAVRLVAVFGRDGARTGDTEGGSAADETDDRTA